MPAGVWGGQVRRWYPAVAVIVGLGAIAGGAALVLPHGAVPGKRAGADACGLLACGAAIPRQKEPAAGRHASPAASSGPRPAAPSSGSPAARSTPASPAPAPTRTGSGSPSGPPGPAVTVTYTPGHGSNSGGRISGTLTLVNHGGQSLSGWGIMLDFPGDAIDWVGAPGVSLLPFDAWHASGGTLILSADSPSETLGPGATERIAITGQGPAGSPSACRFNGSACQG